MATTPDQISLSAEQRQQLAAIAEQAAKPWEQVLSEALAAYARAPSDSGTARAESFLEKAEPQGLIGCVDDGPADLSTNPAHMNGFGTRES
jgi:hypothetical protein